MAETVKAQLSLLYRAGKQTFPDRAESLSEALATIGEIHSDWYAPTVRAGSPEALVKARAINATVYSRLRRAVLSWQDVSYAVVAIADDFAASDAEAARVADDASFTLDNVSMPRLAAPPTFDEVDR